MKRAAMVEFVCRCGRTISAPLSAQIRCRCGRVMKPQGEIVLPGA